MNSKTYDILKNIVIPVLTGGATLVLTLGDIWGLPFAQQIGATMTALATFIAFLVNQSSKAFFADKEIVEAKVNNENVDLNG